MRLLRTVFSAIIVLASGAGTSAAQNRLSVDQRYHGDTLWLTGRGELGPATQRQIFRRGYSIAPDSLWVDFTRNDSLESSRLFVFKGDSVWLAKPDGSRQPLFGQARLIPRAMRTSWEAHWFLEQGMIRPTPRW